MEDRNAISVVQVQAENRLVAQLQSNLIEAKDVPSIHLSKSILSAVLVCIGWNSQTERHELLLMKRPETVSTFKGQICFPGGIAEKNIDISLQETSLREAFEEVGIEQKSVQILGRLRAEKTRGGLFIYPFVGLVEFPMEFVLHEPEVARLIVLPVTDLLETGLMPVEVEFEGFKVRSVGMIWDGELIWGATARMLEQIIELLEPIYR